MNRAHLPAIIPHAESTTILERDSVLAGLGLVGPPTPSGGEPRDLLPLREPLEVRISFLNDIVTG